MHQRVDVADVFSGRVSRSPFVCLLIRPSVHPSVRFVQQCVGASDRLSVQQSVSFRLFYVRLPSICPSDSPSVRPSIHSRVFPPVRLSPRLSVHTLRPSLRPFYVKTSLGLPVSLSVLPMFCPGVSLSRSIPAL